MIVRWSTEAEWDRNSIATYIAADNPRAAARMDEVFDATAASLSEFPHRGRPGSVAGTRELMPHESFRLVYEIDGGTVWILAVFHTARQWPPADQA